MSATISFCALLALLFGLVLACVQPLGGYMARVFAAPVPSPGSAPDATAGADRPPLALRLGAPLERWLYRLCGVHPEREMDWSHYAIALLLFNACGALVVYGLQRLQFWLPLNPQHLTAVSPDSAFNTAVSFITNTNWQGYAGESTLAYLVQMAGLTVQNFLSAATGIVVAIALVRGFVRHGARALGNFWVDVTRATLYVLLPLAAVLAVALASSGVIQDLGGYRQVTTLEQATQTLPMGPVASQESIKELGTNGGGFFNANSAHPYENPNAVSDLLELFAILVIPFALTATFGRMVNDARQGWALLVAMLLLLVPLIVLAWHSELHGNPLLARQGVDQVASLAQSGGNMEGKETRFGIAASSVFAAVTTATSCGAVNSMHDSMTPLGGFVPLFLIQLGELAPGGVGTGLYTILVFAILGVFIAGLMIGRTPEYLGKKIESAEMKLASLFILTTPFLVLIGTALAVAVAAGKAGVANPGPHGFSEILYAFSSAANNNGSAFAGLSANTVFYNVATGIVMWLGRYWPIVLALALAGSLAGRKRIPVTEGTLPTHGPLFVALLIGSILLIGVLTYVPALALGPIVEHFLLSAAT
ncbi:MAG TPA: potassium-transporting ATPase subunit KdpA [Steroidobacteraceae bacterium]|nr:potassium-transporting ATPase subunit KdpA [Steroidobacteraceae bacterium]